MAQRNLLIIGAGGQGNMAAEIAALSSNYGEIAFLDDDLARASSNSFAILGTTAAAEKFITTHEFFVAIGDAGIREEMLKKVQGMQGKVITLVHPKAVVSPETVLGEGCIVMPGCVVNTGTRIGKGVILNTASSVDHDNTIGDFVHIAVGAHLAGSVTVGEKTWIGAGAVVSNNLSICPGCTVGAGAVVVKNIYEKGIYVGTPAKRIR